MGLKEKIKGWFGHKEVEVVPQPLEIKTGKEQLVKMFEELPWTSGSLDLKYDDTVSAEEIYEKCELEDTNNVIKIKGFLDALGKNTTNLNDRDIVTLYKLVKMNKMDLRDLEDDVADKMDVLDNTLNQYIQIIDQRIAHHETEITGHKRLMENDKRLLSKQAITIKHEQSELERLDHVVKLLKQYENLI